MAQHGQQYGNPAEQYGDTNMGQQQHGITDTTNTEGAVVYGGERVKPSGGGIGTGMEHTEHQGQGILHRSGSDSSSSSEDDGEGGRRKKGLKEKIKEKLPGGHEGKDDQPMHVTTGYGEEGEKDEKKGMVEKIKEKLPGGHEGKDDQPIHGAATTGYGQEGQKEEKKGIVEKIKEKLPGGNN